MPLPLCAVWIVTAFAFITSTFPVSRALACQPTVNRIVTFSQDAELGLADKIFTPAMIAVLAAILWTTAPDDVKASLSDQVKPKSLAINFVWQYSSRLFTTLCHEVGHATVQSAVTGRPCQIHLGSASPQKDSFFRVGNIYVDGFNPMTGYTPDNFVSPEERKVRTEEFLRQYRQTHNLQGVAFNKEQLEQMLQSPEFLAVKQGLLPDRRLYAFYLLAGGTVGILGHQGMQAATGQPVKLDSITINQLLNMFVPLGADSDAAMLWRDCVGVSPNLINLMIELAPFLEMAAEIYLTCHDQQNTPTAPLRSKMLVGAINYFSRGYLHFHA